MKKFSLYEFLFSIQYRLIVVMFLLVGIGASVCVGYVIGGNVSAKIGFFASVVLTISTVALSVLLSEIVSFQKNTMSFSDLRDKISFDENISVVNFLSEFNKFIIDNFRNGLFTIDYSFSKVLKDGMVYSSPGVAEFITKEQKESMYEHCIHHSNVYRSVLVINDVNYELIVVPIELYKYKMGFWGVICKSNILTRGSFFREMLQGVENKLLDDQLAIVIKFERFKIWKEFLMQADALSNKIALRHYSTIIEYINEILELTVRMTGCSAASMVTAYGKEHVWASHKDSCDIDRLLNSFPVNNIPKYPVIHQRRNPKIKYVMVVPIRIEAVVAVLYLYDNFRENLEYFRVILTDIENIKLDNDITILADQLQLQKSNLLH